MDVTSLIIGMRVPRQLVDNESADSSIEVAVGV